MNKWAMNNKEKYNEYMRSYMSIEYEKQKEHKKEYYEKNKDEKKKKSLELYYFYKNNPFELEAKKFRRILF